MDWMQLVLLEEQQTAEWKFVAEHRLVHYQRLAEVVKRHMLVAKVEP